MASENGITLAVPGNMLRRRPKMQPCAWCGWSRLDQVHTSYYTQDEQPLCTQCWEVEYNDGELNAAP